MLGPKALLRSLNAVGGRFQLEHRHPARGLLWRADLANGFTAQCLNYLLGAGFKGSPQYSAWRLGVIDDAGFSLVSEDDTHAAHPGWNEFASVGGGTRAAWAAGTPSSAQLASLTAAVVSVTATGTIRGVFLANVAAVGSTDATGILCSTAVATEGLAVTGGGTLTISYTLRARPAG